MHGVASGLALALGRECQAISSVLGGPWLHGPSPAEAPIAPAASLIQLRVKAVSLGGPNAGLAPAASELQGIQLLPHGYRVLAVVAAFGTGRGRVPEVLGDGSMAAPRAGSMAEARGGGLRQAGATVSGTALGITYSSSHVSLTGILVAI